MAKAGALAVFRQCGASIDSNDMRVGLTYKNALGRRLAGHEGTIQLIESSRQSDALEYERLGSSNGVSAMGTGSMGWDTLDGNIEAKIGRFKSALEALSTSQVVRRYLTFGSCHALDEDQHYELKEEIADHFAIHPSEVLVVGSGKLGFSIVPDKRYRHFGDTSDVDVAVVSPRLFESIWREVFDYAHEGGYWPARRDFEKYLFRGWIRPDKLPPSNVFELGNDWWEFFRSLTRSKRFGPYKVRGGLYRSWYFIERYQEIAVKGCQLDVEELT